MVEISDILIVGAGTAGVYFGWLMSKKGYKITIIDRDSRDQVGQRLEVIHFETDETELAGIPPPKQGTPDFICNEEVSTLITSDKKTKITSRFLQTILKLPLFLRRMYDLMESEGVNFYFSCKFTELIYEKGKIVGILVEKDGKKIEFRSRLIVDASGTKAAVRTSLPSNYGIETFKLGPHDVMHVPIRYIVWSNPEEPHPNPITISLHHIAFLNPSYMENGAILGIGQPGSYDQANKVLDDFVRSSNWPPFKVIKTEQGITPYRRPPYSLVADGFLCIGDAAAITRPHSGHGVTATWYLCRIAADVVEAALKEKSYLNKEILWEINVKYFRNQGAQFAGGFALLSGLFYFKENELNYFLKKLQSIASKGSNFLSDLDFNLKAGQYLKIVGGIIWGLIARKLSFKNLRKFVSRIDLSNKIRKHYEVFPENHEDFDTWVENAEKLWKMKTVVIKEFPSTTIEYH